MWDMRCAGSPPTLQATSIRVIDAHAQSVAGALSNNGMIRVAVKFAIKFLATALLLWLAFRKVDLVGVSDVLAGLSPLWAGMALLLTGLIILTDAVLLSGMLRMFERRVPFATALLYSVVGWFFSNVAPSTVGGDIFRGVQLSRVGMPVAAAARLILSIRFLSFVTLAAVMFAGFPVALGLIERARDELLFIGILAAAGGALAGVLLLAHFPRSARLEQWPLFRKFYTLSGDFRRLLVPTARTALCWLAAMSQHLLRVAILAALAIGLGLDIPAATLFAFTPAALLIAMVPVSFGGWGVRELSFVYLLGTAGVSGEAALSLSVAFGLLRIVVGAIGGVAWALIGDHHYRVDASA